jgi:hypothetical protein
MGFTLGRKISFGSTIFQVNVNIKEIEKRICNSFQNIWTRN